ncbi:MAG: hypothetical protein H7Z14_16495 [Anaerolineae bacterium]|nr:hypothetical protein [Phycisphaerae bacterium]
MQRKRNKPVRLSQDFFDRLEPRLLLAATKVVFATSSQTIAAGANSTAITVQLQDAANVPQTAGGAGQVVNLSTSSSGGHFVDAGLNTITSVTVPAGSSSADVFYVDTVAAVPTLAVSSSGLASSLQTETVTANAPTQIDFTSESVGTRTSLASTTITLTLKDSFGNPANAGGGGQPITLSSTSAGATFSTGANTTVTAGTSTKTFTYTDPNVGTPTITVTGAGLTSAQQGATIYNSTTVAVKPDPAGLGSYASTPPGGQNSNIAYQTAYDWINRPANSPLPTNDWWTLILKSGFAGSLYTMPQKLFTQSSGVTVSGYTGINSVANNIGYSGEQTVSVGGNGTTFARDAVVDYSDWMVRFRMEQSETRYVDVTAVQGSPMAWYEFNNVSPTLTFGAAGTYGTISDAAGASLGNGGAGFSTDHFRFTKTGVNFAVFAPAGTVFVPNATGFNVAFAGADHYLAVATLPAATNAIFADFYQHAYAVPRTTTYGYSYNVAAGAITTTWNVASDLLKAGASTDLLQGWLPHNYRDITSGPSTIAGYTYPTIYGTIRVSLGNSFTIVQPTNGLNFVLPAPQQIGGTSDFNPAKMAGWLNTYQLGLGSDSYGGQTTLSQAAQMTLMAKQLNDPNYTRLLNILRTGVTNWLTYQAGDNRFYTYYPKDKALIAYPPAFGSEHYTDLHFHLGYLTSSAAVLAMLDPTWATNYGAIATMVARSYANWDRADTSEPYLRTFNAWRGHSYADGLGDSLGNQGNNQESVSEAVQSWQGLVLLGAALNNQAMLDAGMMGYAIESKSETEYWLNVAHNDLNPPGYPANRNTAINADFTRQQQTFFGNQPKYQLGIVGLPAWPSMDFLGKYNANMQAVINATMAAIGGADPYQTLGNSDDGNNWLAVILGMQAQVNPQLSANEFARYATLNAADNANAVSGIPYYITHANRAYGLRDYNFRLSVPVGGVYTNTTTGKKTYVAYNSSASPQTVNVLNAAGVVIDSFLAGPRTTTVYSAFAAIDGSGILQVGGSASADSFAISQSGSTITVTLGSNNQSFDASSVNSVVFTSLGQNDTLDFNGPVAKPVTFNGGTGNDTLNVNAGTFTFAGDALSGSSNLSVNVAAGATLLFNASQHLAGLNVSGLAQLPANGTQVIVTKSLSIPATGRLDIFDNAMIVDYDAPTSPLIAVQGLISSARSSGTWTGNGLTSDKAKNANPKNTTLGTMEATEFKALYTPTTLFAGETIDTTAVLVKYAYYGDVDFNGVVDFDDYSRIDAGFNNNRTGWLNGDVDGNGIVDFDDYSLIDQAFNTQSAVLRPASSLPPALPGKSPRGLKVV